MPLKPYESTKIAMQKIVFSPQIASRDIKVPAPKRLTLLKSFLVNSMEIRFDLIIASAQYEDAVTKMKLAEIKKF